MSNLLSGSALYNKVASGTVTTYFQKAKQDASYPYCLVQFMTGNDDYTFGDKGINSKYMIKIISDNKFPLQGITLYDYIHDLVQDCVLSIPGYDVLRVRRDSSFIFEDSSHHWNVGGIYMLDIWEQ